MKRRIPYAWFSILVILAILLVGNSISSLAANLEKPSDDLLQQADNTLEGLDLIILLDHSGSMWGAQGSTPTDPENRRIYTTQYLIDYLSFDSRFVNRDRENRVTVIGFDMHAFVQVKPTMLTDTNVVETAKAGVKAIRGDATNFVEALKMIRHPDVFPLSSDTELESGRRQRLIVVITDGGPDDGSMRTFGQYFDEIKTAYYETYQLAEHYPMYVIGIDDRDLYWSDVESYWNEFATTKKVEQISQVNGYVAEQLCLFLNPVGSPSVCRLEELGIHFVQPYAQTVSFSFFKYESGEKIKLYRPDGSLVVTEEGSRDPDVIDYTSTSRDEMIVISKPEPGCWRSESSEESNGEGQVDVIAQVIFNDLRMVEPDVVEFPLVLPLQLGFELREAEGKLLPEYDEFPVMIEGSITAPDGSEQALEFENARDASGRVLESKYVSTGTPRLYMAGEHTIQVRGFTAPENLESFGCWNSSEPLRIFENTYQIPMTTPELKVMEPVAYVSQYEPLNKLVIGYSLKDKPVIIPDTAPWKMDLIAVSPSNVEMTLPEPVLVDGAFHVDGQELVFSETGNYKLRATLKTDNDAVIYEAETTLKTGAYPLLVTPHFNYPAHSIHNELQIQLADSRNAPVSANSGYPLRLEAELLWPGDLNESDLVMLTPVEDSPGLYSGQIAWILGDEGEYTLHVRGYLTLKPGDEQLAFDVPVSIWVSTSIPYFRIVSPDPIRKPAENIYSLHRGLLPISNPMKLTAEIWRDLDQVKPEDVFVDDPDQLVNVRVFDSQGQLVVDRTLSLAEDEKTLQVSLPELSKKGIYTATFSFKGQVIGRPTVESFWPSQQIVFQRQDPTWVLVVWWALGILFTGAILLIAGWLASDRIFLPKLYGTLVVVTTGAGIGQELFSVPLTHLARHSYTIKGKQLVGLNLESIRLIGRRNEVVRNAQGVTEERIVDIELDATTTDKKPAAHGTLSSKKRERPVSIREGVVPCNKPDTNNKRYQFKLKL